MGILSSPIDMRFLLAPAVLLEEKVGEIPYVIYVTVIYVTTIFPPRPEVEFACHRHHLLY